jgi:hypothetical protein
MNRMGMLCAATVLTLLSCSRGAPSEPQQSDTLNGFLKTLASGTDAARVDYQGSCDVGNPNRIIPPEIMVAKASASQRGPSLVRAMLANTRDAAVRESAGVIYVKIGKVDGSILRTGIKSLTLVPNQQYDPSEAIWALENSQDVQLEMRKRNMRVTLTQGGLESMLAEGEPHLASTIRNVTFDEALGQIARKFSGAVVYGECRQASGQVLISIRFLGH